MKAILWEKMHGEKVRCKLCERRCEIPPSGKGFCKTRVNRSGELFTLSYGDLSAVENRPIEIKPFFHFYPGSLALTFSPWSCNLRCRWCQNFHLSRKEPSGKLSFPPSEIISQALKVSHGLCISFTEPLLLFEYSIDCFKVAKEKGLYTCIVSNGYMTEEALRMLRDAGMDGIKIDVKGNSEVYDRYCGGADAEKIWRNARISRELGLWVEIVNLVVTGVNEDLVEWVIERHLKEVGPETPLHFTRYHPAHNFTNPPTKVEVLERAYEKARKMGVLYPYIGNVPGHPYENTYCDSCQELLIKRMNYSVLEYRIKDGRCEKCRNEIPGKLLNFPPQY
jgi:pyruvate formate lyase activating enzyme